MIETVAEIVAAFVKRNQVATADLPALIASVSASISALTNPVPVAEALTPAVPIKRSITPSAIVCLDCGWRGKMLRRHLSTRHKMTPEQYRGRWGLPLSHALTAPNYKLRRSEIAKSLGLGRRRGTDPAPIPAPDKAASKRRPRKAATAK
jgi:predicted transcriptional regulator